MNKHILSFLLVWCLSVAAFGQYSGSGPVRLVAPSGVTSVQWYKDGAAISGATSTSYVTATPGTYYATYTDNGTVCTADQTTQFVLLAYGTTVTLNGTTNNGGGTNYQWIDQTGVPVTGATSANYTTGTGGSYALTYNNGTCTVSSRPYYVFVLGLDSDNDGFSDSVDLDDDNDGILDTAENLCTTQTISKTGVTVTSTLTWTGSLSLLVDGVVNQPQVLPTAAAIAGQTVLQFDFPSAVNLTNIELRPYVASFPIVVGSVVSLQGWNGSSWVSLVSSLTVATPTTGISDPSQTSYKFAMPTNTASYTKYRIQGVSGSLQGNWTEEAYFQGLCTIAQNDLDGDGIVNSLDLDADGDGCADAIEGGGNFTVTNLVSSSMAGGSTNESRNLGTNVSSATATYGVPVTAGTGQTIGASQSATVQDAACPQPDYDGDNVPDSADLDDDNDGILDTVEDPACQKVVNGSGQNNLAGWTATGNVVSNNTQIIFNFNETPATGVLSQTISTVPNQPLQVKFDMVGFGSNTAGNASLRVDVLTGSTVIATKTVTKTFGNPFTNETLSFLPTTNQTIIRFTDLSTVTSQFDPIISGISVVGACGLDSDNDGIINSLDLDSDGDGCADAIEGGAGFTTSNLVSSSLAGGSTNVKLNLPTPVGSGTATLGVPTIAGTGQTTGYSQLSALNECTDTDGDGVADSFDLDDDNDGILDVAEGCTDIITNGGFLPSTNTSVSTIPNWNLSGTYTTFNPSSNGIVVTDAGLGLFFLRDGSTVSTLSQTIDGVKPNTLINLNGLGWLNTVAGNDAAGESKLEVKYNGVTYATISTGASGSGQPSIVANNGASVNSTNLPAVAAIVTYSSTIDLGITLPANIPSSGVFSIVFTGGTSPSNADDIFLKSVSSSICNGLDSDNDGIVNSLDLDSDGDGCADAIEGGANFTASNLVSSTLAGGNSGAGFNGTSAAPVTQNLGNTVGSTTATMGVPTIAGTGQTIGISQNGAVNGCADADGDGVLDLDDLDDDNDGILDTVEDGNCEKIVNGSGANGFTGWTPTGNVFYNLSPQFSFNYGDSAPTGVLSQTISTIPNQGLQLKFNAVGWGGNTAGNVSVRVDVLAGSTVLATKTVTKTFGIPWTIETLNFTPTSTSTTIRFTDVSTVATQFDFIINGVSVPGACDLDGDGIVNSLDLDGDGDGCPDAIEGGAAFTTSNLVSSTLAGGSTNVTKNLPTPVGSTTATMGVPTIAGMGQTIGTSQSSAVNGCTDTDGDGVPDLDDLDDDNDGILDTVEDPACQKIINGTGGLNTGWTKVGNITEFTGLFAFNFNTTTPNGVLSQTVTTVPNQNLQLTFTAEPFGGTAGTVGIQADIVQGGVVIATKTVIKNLSSPSTAETLSFTPGPGPFTVQFTDVSQSTFDIDFVLKNVSLLAACGLDTDNDGIVNSLDLDGDGDGCADAIEGGATFTVANLVSSTLAGGSTNVQTNLGTSVGSTSATMGVPTIAGTGQTIGTSQNASVLDPNCPQPCSATLAPALSATAIANVCPATTINLSTITVSNRPASSTLTWHTGTPATAANLITSVTAVTAGTYYAAFFDATANCYSGTAVTPVSATTIACCPNPSVGGSLTLVGTLPLCSVSNQGTLILSGHTGTVVKWQTSTNGGANWTDIANTAGLTQYNFVNAQNNQQFRAVVNNGGSCSDATSTPFATPTSAAACSVDCDVKPGGIIK